MSIRRIGARTSDTQVHTITSVAAPIADDISRRARRYLFQMTLRTLCFLGAVVTWGRVPTWLSVSLLVGAVVLPYIAVVLANAGRERPEQLDPFSATLQLGDGPAAGAAHPPGAGGQGRFFVYEPSAFPVVDPFGPDGDVRFADPTRGRSGRDGADENGARSA